jgi:hypothetical protein
MDLRRFFLGRAIGFICLLLLGGVGTGVYLIWRDGFNTGLFLLAVSSAVLFVFTLLSVFKK